LFSFGANKQEIFPKKAYLPGNRKARGGVRWLISGRSAEMHRAEPKLQAIRPRNGP
jgi:hypothetical protein